MASNKMFRLVPLMGKHCRLRRPILTQCRTYWPSRRTELWDPFTDMERSMNRLWRELDRIPTPFGALRSRLFDPRYGFREVPIETTQDGQRLYKIQLDLGQDFSPEDINVTIKDRMVTVKARKESESEGCKQLREYSYQYSLPEDLNIEQIKSLLTADGQLTIEAPLPALKEPQATEIPVQKSIADKSEKKE